MTPRSVAQLCALALALAPLAAWSDDDHRPHLPSPASFTTLIITPLAIEGLTGDAAGNLYTTGRAATGTPCPVWRIATSQPTLVQVGSIPNSSGACNPSGITFDAYGNLYIADANFGGVIWKLTANASGGFTSPVSSTDAFATGVPGTNGIAFDRDGNLWTGDGTTNQGRVWRIAPGGGVCDPAALAGCAEVFRIQPMANSAGVGREARTLQPPPTAPNPQNLVANGVAFSHEGDLFIADTARGAIWRAQFDRQGRLQSPTGCDSTFKPNTLCLSNIYVAHPLLEGTDGIALDRAGNIWNSANERNAIVVVSEHRRVTEIFRNPVNSSGLRNAADTPEGNRHILELPTSPFLMGTLLCTANSDGDRRDNSPRAAGEVNGGAATPGARGKISCMDQRLVIPGLPLPVR
jgi:sugar lactone lactonase YvrE